MSDKPDLVMDVAKAFAKADGVDLKAKFRCGGCGIEHYFWEQHLSAAARFVEGYKAVSGKTWSDDRTN